MALVDSIAKATEGDTIECKLELVSGNRIYKHPVLLHRSKGRIEFIKSPFALKDLIKSMQDARWHGFKQVDPRKIWSIKDSVRNRFQLEYLEGGNPYEWFERPLIDVDFPKFGSPNFGYYDLMNHQVLMARSALTYHYQVWAASPGSGKTLAAFATMLLSGMKGWWWVGPKSSLYAIRQEITRWGLDPDIIGKLMSYEMLLSTMRGWKNGDPAPCGVIFDESHRLKSPTSQRSQAAQRLADAIRDEHWFNGYVIEMSGTPAPKSPLDWWSQAEIAWPGFLSEGSIQVMEQRMAHFREGQTLSGSTFKKRISWKNSEQICEECGMAFNSGHHFTNEDGGVILQDTEIGVHEFVPGVNEVERLYERLSGLVVVVRKEECSDLPDVVFKKILVEPSPSTLRVAAALMKAAPNVITGLTNVRALSDGFQYREIEDGTMECPACTDGTETRYYHPDNPSSSLRNLDGFSQSYIDSLESTTAPCHKCDGTREVKRLKRISKEVPCPKEDVLVDFLIDNEEQKRAVVFAGYTGSIDRIVRVGQREGWDTMRVDGRGWHIERVEGNNVERIRLDNPLDYWIENERRKILFVAHPKSGGVALTLCPQKGRPGAVMSLFYSNDFDPASRIQAIDRIHRTGMDVEKGATIVDIIHLPTDQRVLDVLAANRKLELTTLGYYLDDYKDV